MSQEAQKFEFGDFLFDTKENLLLRGGKPVSITPKAFELLRILVKSHGHLVEKDELIRELWSERFVEEGNLSYTVRLLRVALDDSKEKPRFIETVPKRGYRFIAVVESKPPQTPTDTRLSVEPRLNKPSFTSRVVQAAAVAVFIMVVGFGGFWYARSEGFKSEVPVLANRFRAENLSTNGKVMQAVISADGRHVVFTHGLDGPQSVWLRRIETGGTVQIIPPSNDVYHGLELSADGNVLYFARKPQWSDEPRSIYRVSVYGGVPEKVVSGTEGWMSLSPDGTQLSFVRCPTTQDENCSLWIADADGKNERRILARARPERIGDNVFSADGASIVFASGQSQNSAHEFGLSTVNIQSGDVREVTAEKFFNIKFIAQLPGGNGLLITAARIPNRRFGIWHVSAVTGNVEPLTSDSENYSVLSLSGGGDKLVATKARQAYRLHVFKKDDPSADRVLADASRTAFSPDGRIVYSSMSTGYAEIWSMNADGGEQRQLTNDPFDKGAPMAAGDDTIFFVSNRSGSAQVWRMNADGSDQVQITKQDGGAPLFATAEWLYFHHAIEKTVWKVRPEGGDEQKAINISAHHFAFSPDGSMAAHISETTGEKSIEILAVADGKTLKRIRVAGPKPVVQYVAWTPDGKEVAYALVETDENYVLRQQPLDGSPSRKVADLGRERISSFAISPDGLSFAVTKGNWPHDAVMLGGLK